MLVTNNFHSSELFLTKVLLYLNKLEELDQEIKGKFSMSDRVEEECTIALGILPLGYIETL